MEAPFVGVHGGDIGLSDLIDCGDRFDFRQAMGGDRAGVIARGCAGPKRAAFAPWQAR
jgi:hypothetical protein